MKHIQLLIIITLAIIGVAISCRPAKTIQTAIAKKDTTRVIPVVDPKADSMRFIRHVMDTVQKNRIDFKTCSAKIKVHFESDNGKRYDFNAFIRIKKDSIIWITINALLGLDAFRVKITPDSVIVVNKLDKVVQFRSVGYLQEVSNIPMTFSDLQNLLIGNPVFLDSNNINSYRKDDRSVSLISVGVLFKHLLTVNKTDYTLMHSKLDDVDAIRARTADLTYADYEEKNGIRFATYRRITVSEKRRLDIEMQFKQFDFNVDLSFPFSIPRNYTRQ